MLNCAVIMGRLTADPELRTTNSGISVTSFSVAVDRSYQRAGQERQTDFINVVAWRQTAEFVTRYFHKGSMIAVQGSIQTRKYTDRNGNNRTAFEIVADNVSFCGSKAESNTGNNSNYGNNSYSGNAAPQQNRTQNAAPSFSTADTDDFASIDSDDSDLPF
ncbi:MAG: single-stranded DNA-binding protein [Oscillospiraceae bacterium]|jgi:single-strand DNA-binding protein|nr:single-stranded DNA-binding protein [Oscillospiraceae bacterium]